MEGREIFYFLTDLILNVTKKETTVSNNYVDMPTRSKFSSFSFALVLDVEEVTIFQDTKSPIIIELI